MQYDFNLGANGAQFIDVKGTFFRYKNGTGKIRVRNSTGGFIDLVPGQGVNGLEFSSLNITDLTGAPNTGYLLAGDYEFLDSTVTITGGTVQVTSLPAVTGTVAVSTMPAVTGTVAVSTMPAVTGTVAVSTLPAVTGTVAVSTLPAVTGTVAVSANSYTFSFASTAAANVALQAVSAASNVNGVVINRVNINGGTPGSMSFSVLAKSTAPASMTDGDFIDGCCFGSGPSTYSSTRQIKIPAGKAVWFISTASETTMAKTMLYTLL